jgi:hypothetical protein
LLTDLNRAIREKNEVQEALDEVPDEYEIGAIVGQGEDEDDDDDDDVPRRPPRQEMKLTPNLSSHSNKREATERANEHPNIHTTWACFRAGWILKAIHTIFDYLSPNRSNDEQVALVMSEWQIPDLQGTGTIGGGNPPLLRVVIENHAQGSKVEHFVNQLFLEYTERVVLDCTALEREEMYGMMTAAVLNRLDSFLAVLYDHPTQMFGTQASPLVDTFKSHDFLVKLRYAAQLAKIDEPEKTLMEWNKMIFKDFITRNFGFAHWSDIQSTNNETEPINTDTRTLAGFMNTTAHTLQEFNARAQSVATQVQHQGQEQHRFRQELEQIGQVLERQGRLLEAIVNHFDIQVPAATSNSSSAAPAPVNASASPIINPDFPSSFANVKHIKTAFLNWHVRGYYQVIGSRGVVSAQCSNCYKFAIEYFSLFLVAHLPALPAGARCGLENSELAKQWRDEVRTITDETSLRMETHLKAYLIHIKHKRKSVPTGVAAFKSFMALHMASWPAGPPGESQFQPPNAKHRMKTRAALLQNHTIATDRAIAKKRKRDEATLAAAQEEGPEGTPEPQEEQGS